MYEMCQEFVSSGYRDYTQSILQICFKNVFMFWYMELSYLLSTLILVVPLFTILFCGGQQIIGSLFMKKQMSGRVLWFLSS